MAPDQNRTLTAPMRVSFDYTRSVGPVLGEFFAGLRDARIIAGRTADGNVVAPPPEFDPVSHEQVTDFVEVGPAGTVESWSWVPEPVADQPFDRPFAWVLVRLDGATRPFLHALDAGRDGIHVGLRVEPRWREETTGAITDIASFVPATGEARLPVRRAAARQDERLVTPVHLDYLYAASPEESAFFRALAQGRVLGQRCPTCGKVYVPPRGACPVDGVPTSEEVELAHTGTITTFCIVNVPFLGQKIKPPYVSAYVLLDGAD
ncbi:MAG: OB-fold domain-containing protein, partial [Nocardioides sp.]|nr:OB-fold domain-containing protein [Nocardioides sp.]